MLNYPFPMSDGNGRLVILGGGFAGTSALNVVGRAILVDKNEYMTFTNKLVDVVEGKDPNVAVVKHRSVLVGEVKSIDLRSKVVKLKDRELKYDKLIIALGYEQDLAKIPGASKYAQRFLTLEDALSLRVKLPKVRKVIIVGGGALGVELAGVLTANQVTLLESRERILSFLSPTTSRFAEDTLLKRGVNVLKGVQVHEVKENSVETTEGEFQADLVVFSAGFVGPKILEESGLSTKGGRMLVDRYLRSIDDQDVFGAGDCANVKDGFIPMSAQVASQAGEVASLNALGQERPFTPVQRAIVLRIGNTYFGESGGRLITGPLARLIKDGATVLSMAKALRT